MSGGSSLIPGNHKVTRRDLGIAGALILVLVVPAGTFYTTHVRTTQSVESLLSEVEKAEEDRDALHEDVNEVRISLTGLKAAVIHAERAAEERDQDTNDAIDELTQAVNRRRR